MTDVKDTLNEAFLNAAIFGTGVTKLDVQVVEPGDVTLLNGDSKTMKKSATENAIDELRRSISDLKHGGMPPSTKALSAERVTVDYDPYLTPPRPLPYASARLEVRQLWASLAKPRPLTQKVTNEDALRAVLDYLDADLISVDDGVGGVKLELKERQE